MSNNKPDANQKSFYKPTLYRYDMPHGIKFDYQSVQPSVEPHSHAFIEIFYILDGKIDHTFNGISSTLSTGDFALIDNGSVHHFTKFKDENCSVINILFYPSFIDMSLSNSDGFKDILCSRELQNSNNKSSNAIPSDLAINQVYHEDNNTIKNLILNMQHEFFSCEFEYLKILKFLLITLLTYILRHMLANSITGKNATPIDNAIAFIHNNYYRNITLSELSEISHYSPQHFCRKFKATTGYSFSEYLQKTRIDYSCRLLQHTNMKITEIANAVGYNDLQHYELLFRKYIDRSPSEHRKFFKKAANTQIHQI